MNFENVTFFPDFWIDLVVYAVIAVVLLVVSRWVWEEKELKRMKKLTKLYQQAHVDEMIEEGRVKAADLAEDGETAVGR